MDGVEEGESEGESVVGEKEPGIECRTGGGNTRGDRGAAARLGEGLSMGDSRGVVLLEEASDSRVGSELDEG
jgi:hypothetical protein